MTGYDSEPPTVATAAVGADWLAALDEKRPGPVLTRDIERGLERSGEAPVYGLNLRVINATVNTE